ncbi:MAG: hypothetical protein H6Q00_1086, partial [Holophagaceae bacterium]|nr:hypothetical protein [Holophagaceae bacterium]
PATGRLQGIVLNATTGGGIAGATVSCDSVMTTTNADGGFALNLPYADRVLVGVTAPGYAENHQVAAITSHDTNNPNALTVKLLAATTVTFDNLDDSRILTPPTGAAQVSLPANALVTASGAAPTFPVTASLTPIDPTFEPRLMPGDYTTSAGQLMQSYGALDVTFTDNSGRPLNLVQGKSATIRIPVSAKYHTETAPESVPAFWFDTATGKWVEEGTLTLGGEGLDQYYEGTVSHFTTWNADNATDTSIITGYVVRTDGSYVAGATVTAGPSTGNDWTSTVTSGSDGSFKIYVKANAATLINASLGYLNSAAPGVSVTSAASGTKVLGNTAASTPARANSILIDGILNLTGTLRDFSPSAPYAYAPVNANRVTNGTFNTPTTPWVTGTGWTIGSNSATCASGSDSIRQTLGALASKGTAGLVSGYKFRVTFTVNSRTSGSVTPVLGGTSGTVRNSTGTFSEEITCGTANTDIAFLSNNFKGTISNVSVQYFPENMVIDYNTSYPLYTTHPILKYWDGPWWLPDFESSNTWGGQMKNLVNVDLGTNNKPVFNSAQAWSSGVNSVIQSGTTFDLWWTDFPSPHGPNDTDPYQMQWPIPLKEVLPATTPKTYRYINNSQFPIDGQLQGIYVYNNQGGCSGTRGGSSSHNFHYTYELHTTFTYQSGQKFDFTGDDDVWVFINKKLVIDLGGIHGSLNGSITLNASAKDTSGAPLNLVAGQSYQFDFFYCERHTTESHMQITTSIPLDSTDIPK